MRAQIVQIFGMHPLTLRFDDAHEGAFQKDYFQKSLNHLRLSLALGIFLYAMFGVLDYLLIPAVKEQIWFIRYVIVCPVFILNLLLTWNPYYRKVWQPSIVVAVLIAGYGIIAMTMIAYPPGSYYYYAGLILVLMWVYTFTTARFVYATFAGWMLVIGYEVVAIGIEHTPLPVLISNSFFFLSANIIGMLSCYLIEYYKRRDFWQRQLLDEQRTRSEALLLELKSELALASDIQKSLLPPPSVNWPGGELICYSKPTLEIGGDFYTYHMFEDGRIAFAMGDVSGNGIPAALLMAASLSLFGSTFSQELDPCERLIQLDSQLVPHTKPQHQNCAFCYIELDRRSLSIVNAGGIPPYIRKVSGEVEHPNVGGIPLGHGLGEELGYQGVELALSPGDQVILVSDGIVEARDRGDRMFGFTRLGQVIASGPTEDARAMLAYLVSEVITYVGKSEPQDDFTIAVMQIRS